MNVQNKEIAIQNIRAWGINSSSASVVAKEVVAGCETLGLTTQQKVLFRGLKEDYTSTEGAASFTSCPKMAMKFAKRAVVIFIPTKWDKCYDLGQFAYYPEEKETIVVVEHDDKYRRLTYGPITILSRDFFAVEKVYAVIIGKSTVAALEAVTNIDF